MLLQLVQEMLTLLGGLIVFYFVYVFFTRKNDKPVADTPSMAHTALRELVERAVDEARKLPGLGDSVTTRRQDNSSINEQSYEDLLAAAILNKVIEKYQKGRVDGNSNVVHETTSRICRHKRSEMGGNEGNEGTSQDECSSECSCTKTKLLRIHQDPLSLTIEEQIEEVTTTYTSDEEPKNMKTNLLNFRNTRRVPFPEYGMDIVDPSQESSGESEDEIDGCAPVDRITPSETWEENWLFQKKRIPTQSESVAMLVPNPSEDYRALIGDKDADDMSDLSEFSAQSDDEEVDDDLIEAINRVLPESKEVKKNPLNLSNDSSILDCNFTGEITRENYDNLKSQIEDKRVAKKKRGEVNEEVKRNVEKIVRDEFEMISKDEENVGKKNEAEYKNLSEMQINEKTINLNEKIDIPKTPASTPIRNSLCESDSLLPEICDLRKLSEKLVTIDNEADEEAACNSELSTVESGRPSDMPESEECVHEFLKNEEIRENQDSSLLNEESSNNLTTCEKAAVAKAQSIASAVAILNDGDLELSAPPRPGSIAEREHKKWENAAPIQNNPYSEENIQKRLLERQYARRSSSDVSGNSGMLPTSPSPPLQIVIGANRPDVQRFARDYYINESRSPTGERLRRPGTSSSSRPSSSLSLNSTTGSSDYEHQVSQGLEKFEEASLRGSLQRSTYSGPNTTHHFVTNPLIHLDQCNSNESALENNSIIDENKISNGSEGPGFIFENVENVETGEDDGESVITCTINPIYNCKSNLLPMENTVDRDSGMFSIDSSDYDLSKADFPSQSDKNEDNSFARLTWNANYDQMYKRNGKKYWILDGFNKFQTFGGIKRRKMINEFDEILEDFEDSPDNPINENNDTDFSRFKYQTFGGIKQRCNFDKNAIGICRKQKMRSSIKNLTKSKLIPFEAKRVDVIRQKNINESQRTASDDENLRLKPPLVPNVVERNYTSLIDLRKDLRCRRRKKCIQEREN